VTARWVRDSFVGMILLGSAAFVSEFCCLSDGGPQPGRGGAGWPQLALPAAGVLAAQGDDTDGKTRDGQPDRRVLVKRMR
jgi:hypothetical protein